MNGKWIDGLSIAPGVGMRVTVQEPYNKIDPEIQNVLDQGLPIMTNDDFGKYFANLFYTRNLHKMNCKKQLLGLLSIETDSTMREWIKRRIKEIKCETHLNPKK